MGEMFHRGGEMTRPYTSGLRFGALSYEQLRRMTTALTEEEGRAPSAKYYDEPMAELSPEHAAAVAGGPLAPEECHMPGETGALLLADGGRTAENGYGVLPNGVGYAAIKIEQAGITDDMIRNYRERFAHDGPPTLFYKLWFPGAHLIHYEDGVAEDFGWGMLNLEMNRDHFMLRHLGITREDIVTRDPQCICLLGLCGRGWKVEHPEDAPIYTCMVQHTRLTSTGRELRVRYWSGISFAPDGAISYHVKPGRAETLEQMKKMMEHCMREYSNERRLMQAFWRESQ